MKKDEQPEAQTLRQKAEEALKMKPASELSHYTAAEVLKLTHELEVKQIELEIQNIELLQAQLVAQDAIDLYDFAPTGYFTLSEKSKIIGLNLSGALMLGEERPLLIDSFFSRFISEESKPVFNQFLKEIFLSKTKQACEILLLADGKSPIYAHLSGIIANNEELCLVTSVDITARKQAEEELKESKSKYQFIVETTDDILWTMNPDFTFDYISPSVYNFLGYTVEEHLKMPLSDYFTPESAKLVVDEFQIGMMNLQSKQYDKLRNRAELEIEFVRKDKTRGYGIITMTMVRDEQHRIKKIRGRTIDITARKLAEEAVSASKDYLNNIINSLGSPVFVKDSEFKFCVVNDALCSLLNLPRNELIGKTGREYFPDDQNEVFFLKDKEVFASGEENINEEFLTDGSGNIRTIITRKTLFTDAKGTKFLVGVINDITEQKVAEKARLESEEKFKSISNQLEAILDHIPGLVFFKDKQNNFIRVNKYAAHGRPKSEMEGKNLSEIYPKEDAEKYYEDDLVVINSGIAKLNIEEHWNTSEGVKWVNTSKIPFIDSNGEIIGVIGMSVDITDRKNAEMELILAKEKVEQSERELRKINEENQTIIDTLKQANIELSKASNEISERKLTEAALTKKSEELAIANKELNQFAYVASHDLQEPLRTISNFAGLLEKKGNLIADKDMSQYLGFILKATDKMQNLIKALLDFSRIGREVSFESVDCNVLVDEVISELAVSINESKAQIRVGTLPVLTGNQSELRRLFMNLLGNAIKFRKKNAALEIDISVTEKEHEFLFAVRDNGIGIEEQYSDRIFIIFQRLHLDNEYPGTGIGLAACSKIATLHNGKIWVESALDKGSTFYFTISKTIEG
ncbi:MAG: PAS domain S-box protein [Bacteroidota bacterium]